MSPACSTFRAHLLGSSLVHYLTSTSFVWAAHLLKVSCVGSQIPWCQLYWLFNWIPWTVMTVWHENKVECFQKIIKNCQLNVGNIKYGGHSWKPRRICTSDCFSGVYTLTQSQGNQTQTWSLSFWVWFVPEECVPQSAVPPILKD